MNSFSELVTSSVLARSCALIVLFLAMVLAMGIAAFDLISGRPIPGEVSALVSIGLGFALTILGINYGVILQPAKGNSTNGTTNP